MKTILLLVFVVFAATAALADGGRLRLHSQAGPFVVSLFTTPDPLRVGQADFSVAVERQGLDGLDENAEVTFLLTPSGSHSQPLVLHASHSAATSRFLQAANFRLPRSGVWEVAVVVAEGQDVGRVSEIIEVLPASLLSETMFWEIALVPLMLILFGLHQWRKRVVREGRERTRRGQRNAPSHV